MIEAIGIYDKSNDELKKLAFAYKNKTRLFSPNLLENFENTILSSYKPYELVNNRIYCVEYDDHEFYYYQRLANQHIVFAIHAKKEIFSQELHYLFNNIKFVYFNKKTRHSLDSIVNNYCDYIGKDIRFMEMNEQLQQTRNKVVGDILKVYKRGIKTEDLSKQSIQLQQLAENSKWSAHKKNNCSC